MTKECSNLHCNLSDGYLHKLNLYNGLPDRLQISYSQRPIEKLNLVKQLYGIFEDCVTKKEFKDAIQNLEKSTSKQFSSLKINCEGLVNSEVPLRAEFRISLNRYSSIAPIITSIFNDKFIQENCYVFDMETVSKLLVHWTILLTKPISKSLTQIHGIVSGNQPSCNCLVKFTPTLSVFESLIFETLFCGSTRSYLNEILWSNSSKNDNFESMRLKQSIETFNRLNFSGSSWVNDHLLIQGDERLLQHILSKYKLKNGIITSTIYNLQLQLNNEKDLSIVARALWESYFDLLWERASEDFEFVNEAEMFSIENLKISEKIVYRADSLTYSDATHKVFDPELFLKSRKGQYKVPYIISYIELLDSHDYQFKRDLDHELILFAIENINYIHAVGGNYRFFRKTGNFHKYLGINGHHSVNAANGRKNTDTRTEPSSLKNTQTDLVKFYKRVKKAELNVKEKDKGEEKADIPKYSVNDKGRSNLKTILKNIETNSKKSVTKRKKKLFIMKPRQPSFKGPKMEAWLMFTTIVKSCFPNDTDYYIRVIIENLQIIRNNITWSRIHANKISKKKQNITQWNRLLCLLVDSELVIEVERKIVIRMFRIEADYFDNEN